MIIHWYPLFIISTSWSFIPIFLEATKCRHAMMWIDDWLLLGRPPVHEGFYHQRMSPGPSIHFFTFVLLCLWCLQVPSAEPPCWPPFCRWWHPGICFCFRWTFCGDNTTNNNSVFITFKSHVTMFVFIDDAQDGKPLDADRSASHLLQLSSEISLKSQIIPNEV